MIFFVFSTDIDCHVSHVHKSFDEITLVVFLKAEKCEFQRSSVSFLGYVIAEGEVQMDSAKVNVVSEWANSDQQEGDSEVSGFC